MPDDSKNLLEQVKDACTHNSPLRIAGNDSKRFMGRRTTGKLLTVSGHSGIVSYEPTELVITVRSGTKIVDVDAALAEHMQFLGSDPPAFNRDATIGGTLACNQSGPARPWFGSIRDHVLGVRLINGRGEHLRYGGRVLKNVAGYDVSRLQAGAMGTLGIITEISLRVFPRPEYTATGVSELDCRAAIEMMNNRTSKGGPLCGAAWVDNRLYLRYSGCEPAVRSHTREIGGHLLEDCNGFWTALREQRQPFFAGDEPLWRFSVESGADHFDEDGKWLIDWGGAQRWLRGDYEFKELETMADRIHGQVSLYRGGDRDGEVFHSRSKTEMQVHKRIKSAFDPQGIFNPGRLYSWM